MAKLTAVCCQLLLLLLSFDTVTPLAQLPLQDCRQSSTLAPCRRAIDHNTNQKWSGNSCSHTNMQNKPWWQANTGRLAHFRNVRIYNRLCGPGCSSHQNNIVIKVDGVSCASYHSKNYFSVKTFHCSRVGQVLEIQSTVRSYLMLCEVQVFGNWASLSHKGSKLPLSDCRQSSTHTTCQRAIDNNLNQHWSGKSCSHTRKQKNPWWQANTNRLAHIKQVRIYTRLCYPTCRKYFRNIVVRVDGHICARHKGVGLGSTITLNCNRVGQIVEIQALSTTYLMLCEVQVFGTYASLAQKGDLLKLNSCRQSSMGWKGVCQRAIDGNTNQRYGGKSCTHTKLENGWWMAKTQKLAHIKEVRIFNRADCCSNRLTDFVVTVDGHVCGSYKSSIVFMQRTFRCDRVGSVVMVRSRKRTYLTLCEVQVFGQYLKRRKLPKLKIVSCFQTSVGWHGVCKRAIDGNTSQDYKKKSCSHTKKPGGFWQGSLSKPAHIKQVVIYNRLDCCSDRLNNFDIIVDGKVCAKQRSRKFFSVKSFKCDMVGRNVIIRMHGKKYLTLCEVEVFGDYTKMSKKRTDLLPLSKCSQSSVGYHGVCSRAIDGNKNQHYWGHSCTHTKLEKGWWMAKTRKLAHIKEIKIFNRADCCANRLNDFVVTVDGHECASYKSRSAFKVKTLKCNKLGRVVKIKSRKRTYLTLCEVQVFGEYSKNRPKLKYLGCFFDTKEHPDFSIKAESSSAMTQRRCNSLCKSRGTAFFAVQSGSLCFCGDNYGNNGEAADTDCSSPCSGDSGIKCGGKMRSAVFKVDRTVS